jgi:hypothetical protein
MTAIDLATNVVGYAAVAVVALWPELPQAATASAVAMAAIAPINRPII